MKELFLLRGLPGSGKSTLARSLTTNDAIHIEADMFFVDSSTGEYRFDATKLKDAHKWCRDHTEICMQPDSFSRIIVSNTFTQEWEMKSYFELAEQYDYKVYSLIVENRHGGVNEHGVPDEVLTKMKDRFEVKLK
jgi:predicted kinase